MKKKIEYLLLKDQYSKKEVGTIILGLAERLETGDYDGVIIRG